MKAHFAYLNRIKGHNYPLDYRLIGGAIDRLAQSEFVLSLFRRHLDSAGPNKKNASICVFGSIGRGEFDLRWSDVDVMFIGFSRDERNVILSNLIMQNSGFDFHGANELLKTRTKTGRSALELRFPNLSVDDLLNPASAARRIQFLFEARPVYNETHCDELLEKVVRYYGLEQRPKLRTEPEKLLGEMDAFFQQMDLENANRIDKNSDYFAKHFMIREFGQHLSRLSLMAAIFQKTSNCNSPSPALSFARHLRRPNLLKLLFWNETDFVMGRTLSVLEAEHGEDLSRALVSCLRGLPGLRLDWRKANAATVFGQIVQLGAMQYDNTIDLLYTEEVRAYLQKTNANVLKWETDPHLQRIKDQCKSLRRVLKTLGDAINVVYELAGTFAVHQKPFQGRTGLQAATDSFIKHLTKEEH